MKAKLVPVFFPRDCTEKFSLQTGHIKEKLADCAELLEPVGLGETLPAEADAVLLPEILGEAYERSDEFAQISIPILVLTSEFMTISMWDWEIMNFLRGKGVSVLAPYHESQARVACRALALRKSMAAARFLVFQDNPGEGFQPEIFKCFYWWTDECTKIIRERLGITITRKSLKDLGKTQRTIPQEAVLEELSSWKDLPVSEELTEEAKQAAARYYLSVKQELAEFGAAGGIGANCLNESHFSSSTPCIAWNLLFEREGILWACEGDTLSLAVKYLLHHTLQIPVMMTNIYPFLMGMAALKHERIPSFPEIIDEPENHILLAHCGFFGLAPRSFCSSWKAVPPVLGIVDKKAHALDVRFPEGPVTMVKIDGALKHMMVIEGELKGYMQYPGSDCRNGAVMKVPDGHSLMKQVYSHHQILMPGHHRPYLELICRVFGFEME